jgi:hypothetical protein
MERFVQPQTVISIVAITVSLIALSFVVKNYLRKSGTHVRGQFSVCSSSSCDDKYVSNIALENAKDRPVVIFKIFLLVGRNYYVELENFEDNPLILKPYEAYTNQFDPVDFYSVSMRRIRLDKLFDSKKVKSNIILSTSEGKYVVKDWINRWDPISDFFDNHMTALIHPMRSTYKNKCFGSRAKYILDIKTADGSEEVIAIYPRDFETCKFNGFQLTIDCLETKESLETFLLEKAIDGSFKCNDFIVQDIEAWRNKRYSDNYDEVIEAEYVNWFMYNVVGKVYSKLSDIKLSFQNWRLRKANKQINRT